MGGDECEIYAGHAAADLFEKVGEPSLRRMTSLSVNGRGISWPTWQVCELPQMVLWQLKSPPTKTDS